MFTLNCKGRLMVVDKPWVMGIINVTPDSFYAGSRFEAIDAVLVQAEKMLLEGADVLDIGAQSSRPGSERVSPENELRKLIPCIEAITKRFPEALLSVDTFYAKVSREAVGAGAAMINDISAGSLDAAMIETVAALRVPYVLMHMRGEPGTMQQNPRYDDVTREILDFFKVKLTELKRAGIHDIILDPGFGFGKTIQQNFKILQNFSVFQVTGLPLLAGLSRKSTIYKTLGISAGESLNGTTVMNTLALLNGASILRVHDVREALEAVRLLQEYRLAAVR